METKTYLLLYIFHICSLLDIQIFIYHVSDQLHLVITHRMKYNIRILNYPDRLALAFLFAIHIGISYLSLEGLFPSAIKSIISSPKIFYNSMANTIDPNSKTIKNALLQSQFDQRNNLVTYIFSTAHNYFTATGDSNFNPNGHIELSTLFFGRTVFH